jgi:biopolymer transport protein ExbD
MPRTLIRLRQNPHEEPMINLTPLIDVVFVMLIMFILVAPLLELETIQLATGPASAEKTPQIQEQSPISIYVKPDNSIWFNQQSLTSSELAKQLVQAHQRYPNAVPQLFQDQHSQFGTYQGVKNVVEAAGFERLDLILNPG